MTDSALSLEPAAEAADSIPSEPLSWEEICERYPDEWVCLSEMEPLNPCSFEFKTARVVGHGKASRDPYVTARPWFNERNVVGHYYTGALNLEYRRPRIVMDDELRELLRYDNSLIRPARSRR